jgi:hypothetical protein
MANEINLQATLVVQRGGTALQASGNDFFNQTGSRSACVVQNVAVGSNSTFQIDGSTNMAWAFVKNNDTGTPSGSYYVHVAYDNSSPPTQIIAKLRSKEFCLVPLKDSTTAIYARAFGYGSAVEVMFLAAQG